jgi:hypothetical protein
MMADFYQFSQGHTLKPVFFKIEMCICNDNKGATLMRKEGWRWQNSNVAVILQWVN